VRITGETIALTPPLTISEAQIGEVADKLKAVIRSVA
jgi:beta-alanine--pyruvate transaminase